MTFSPHPKGAPKAKKPGAMRSKPKAASTAAPLTEEQKAAARASHAVIGSALMGKPPKAPKPAKAAKAKTATKKARAPKPAPKDGGTKSDLILGMLKAPGGASSKEIEAATGWAPHSVRGFLGTLRKRGVAVLSKKFAKGEATVYSIEAAPEPEAVGEVL